MMMITARFPLMCVTMSAFSLPSGLRTCITTFRRCVYNLFCGIKYVFIEISRTQCIGVQETLRECITTLSRLDYNHFCGEVRVIGVLKMCMTIYSQYDINVLWQSTNLYRRRI